MPATSAKQYAAMQAAAHGQGRLGIPQHVGKEFVAKATPGKRSAFATALRTVRRRKGY